MKVPSQDRLSIVKQILLEDEKAEIDLINKKIVDLKADKDHFYSNRVLHTLRSNPSSIIDIVSPVLGKIISKRVSEALGDLSADINEKLDKSLGIEKVYTKVVSSFSGLSEVEVLLQRVNAKITSLFVIDQETGLLIEKIENSQLNLDPDLFAGLITALSDFSVDTSSVEYNRSLNEIDIGELKVFVESKEGLLFVALSKDYFSKASKNKLKKVFHSVMKNFKQSSDKELLRQDLKGLLFAVNSRKATKNPSLFFSWLMLFASFFLCVISYNHFCEKRIHSIIYSNPFLAEVKYDFQKSFFFYRSVKLTLPDRAYKSILEPMLIDKDLSYSIVFEPLSHSYDRLSEYPLYSALQSLKWYVVSDLNEDLSFSFNSTQKLALLGHVRKADSVQKIRRFLSFHGLSEYVDYRPKNNL